MTGPFADSPGTCIRSRGAPSIQEARQFLHGTEDRFDLIQISLLDSFGGSAAGLYSAAESYLYTTEAFGLYLSRLSDSGLLAVTRWIKFLPGTL